MKKNVPLIIASAVFCILFFTFILRTVDNIILSEDNLRNSPNVLFIGDKIQSKLLVDPHELSSEGEWVNREFDDSKWKSISIPDKSTTADKNFKEGNFAYYRIHIPKDLLQGFKQYPDEVYLALQYIMFSKFQIFVNGKLYRANSIITNLDSIINIPLADNQDNIVALKGWIKTGDIAITHRGGVYIGKGTDLNEFHRMVYKLTIVLPMIYILSIGSVLFLFALIYFVVDVPRSFEKFIGFGLCVIIEKFCTSDEFYGLLSINQLTYIFTVANVGLCTFLFWFFCDASEIKVSRTKIFTGSGVLAAFGFLVAIDTLYIHSFFTFNSLLEFWNIALAFVLLFFIPKFLKTNRLLLAGVCISLGITAWSMLYGRNIGHSYKSVGSLILFFLVAYETFLILRKNQILLRKKEKELLEQEKDVAIGKTAALLAHDVRRPLEQMKLVLDRVSAGETSVEFLDTAKRDIEFSLTSVNNQVSDIMNFSRERSVKLEDTSFYKVLASGLKQVMVINLNVAIQLSYKFDAKISIIGDESRLASVLTNLISNAVEAIRDIGKTDNGSIIFSSKIEDDNFVFSIFNDGPQIPKDHLDKIFNPLFSHGKSQGTGLGLASVIRAIHDLKGDIDVENVNNGVIFKIKLKSGKNIENPHMEDFKPLSTNYSYTNTTRELAVTETVLRVLVLDDDTQVFDYFQFLLKSSPIKFSLTFSSTFEEAEQAIEARRFDLYILDFDLAGSQTGLDLYRQHLNFLSGEVIIHTNRDKSVIKTFNCAHEEKPISSSAFFDLLDKISKSRPNLMVIDDSNLVCMAWKMFHGQHNCITASNPSEALDLLSNQSPPDIFIVDFYFEGSNMSGEELIIKLSTLYPEIPLIISSSGDVQILGLSKISKREFEVRKYLRGIN